MIDLTPIINAAIVLLAGIITAFVIPWVKAYVLPWIDANMTEKQQKLLRAAYKTAVFAAEQLIGAGRGEDKLDYAVKYLESKGYTADRALIEATVKQYFGQDVTSKDEDDAPAEEESDEDEEPQTPMM